MKDNKLIAEFMGVQYKSDEDYIKNLKEMRENGIYFEQGYMESELNYHESWDWLMSVVEKIERQEREYEEGFSYSIQIEFDNAVIWKHSEFQESIRIVEISGSNRFDATYNAVLEFIKWYNETNK